MTSAAFSRKRTGSPTGRTTSWAGSRGWSLEGEAGLDEMRHAGVLVGPGRLVEGARLLVGEGPAEAEGQHVQHDSRLLRLLLDARQDHRGGCEEHQHDDQRDGRPDDLEPVVAMRLGRQLTRLALVPAAQDGQQEQALDEDEDDDGDPEDDRVQARRLAALRGHHLMRESVRADEAGEGVIPSGIVVGLLAAGGQHQPDDGDQCDLDKATRAIAQDRSWQGLSPVSCRLPVERAYHSHLMHIAVRRIRLHGQAARRTGRAPVSASFGPRWQRLRSPCWRCPPRSWRTARRPWRRPRRPSSTAGRSARTSGCRSSWRPWPTGRRATW